MHADTSVLRVLSTTQSFYNVNLSHHRGLSKFFTLPTHKIQKTQTYKQRWPGSVIKTMSYQIRSKNTPVLLSFTMWEMVPPPTAQTRDTKMEIKLTGVEELLLCLKATWATFLVLSCWVCHNLRFNFCVILVHLEEYISEIDSHCVFNNFTLWMMQTWLQGNATQHSCTNSCIYFLFSSPWQNPFHTGLLYLYCALLSI